MNKLIIIIISLLAAIALFFGLVLPKYELVKSKITEAGVKETNLESRKDYYKKVAEISEELKAYSEEISKINFALPEKVSMPQMYDFFQKRASEAGVVLKGEKDSAITQNESLGLKEHHFDLELAGSYSALKNFLSVLEKSARMVEVESISFSSPEESKSSFSFSLSVKFYSY